MKHPDTRRQLYMPPGNMMEVESKVARPGTSGDIDSEEEAPLLAFDFAPYRLSTLDTVRVAQMVRSYHRYPNKMQKEQPKRKRVQVNKITHCSHLDSRYYAKGMCQVCYHSKGRSSPATNCPHGDR